MANLQRIDDLTRPQHSHLQDHDSCYYMHEYTPTGGASPSHYSDANQLIFNFKINPLHGHRLRYKNEAIKRCITDFREVLLPRLSSVGEDSVTFVPIPPSKEKSHPEYDDRVLKLVRGIADGTSIEVLELITQTSSYDPSHLAGGTGRSRVQPDELRTIYQLSGQIPRQNIFLFDDLITAGSHFRAGKDLLLESYPDSRIYGIFIARRSLCGQMFQA